MGLVGLFRELQSYAMVQLLMAGSTYESIALCLRVSVCRPSENYFMKIPTVHTCASSPPLPLGEHEYLKAFATGTSRNLRLKGAFSMRKHAYITCPWTTYLGVLRAMKSRNE